jgi:type VI secretion system protein ImpI
VERQAQDKYPGLFLEYPVQRDDDNDPSEQGPPAEKRAMALGLQLVNETTLPDGGPVSFRITGKRGIDIGRDAHLDWTLPDPTRYISSKHCEIRYKDGGYWLHDVSTNGTFLNGSGQRLAAPHRLRTGDRFTVGHYIVDVRVDGEEGADQAAHREATPAPAPANYEEIWASQGDAPPPIDAKQLKAARLNKPVHSDFLDWAADVPNPLPAAEPDYSPPSSRRPASAFANPASSDMDWAMGLPSHVPAPPPPSPPVPAPRRPGVETKRETWEEQVDPGQSPGAAARVERPAPARVPSAAAGAAPDTLLRQIARAAGLPEDALARKDPNEAAEQIGAILRLVTESLMQLLTARLQAKRLARVQAHTTIQAIDNNPLKFSPSAAEALRLMFGSANAGYLDAHRAIAQGFADLKAHEVKTYSAMRQAIERLMAGLDPQAVEQASDEGRGIAGLLVSRKAKLWDAYQARWDSKIGRDSGGAVEAFIRYFAEAYDRDGG